MGTKMDTVGFIYFIEATELRRIKIGFSSDKPELKRLDALQCGSPCDLRLIGSIPGTRRTEKLLHSRFRELRVRREWFRSESPIWEFIAKVEGFMLPEILDSKYKFSAKPKHAIPEATLLQLLPDPPPPPSHPLPLRHRSAKIRDRDALILGCHRAGWPAGRIADVLNVSHATIKNRLTRLPENPPKDLPEKTAPGPTPIAVPSSFEEPKKHQNTLMLECRRAGWSYRRIAALVNLTDQGVRKRLIRLGVESAAPPQ
jgi:hypothetical protein